MEKELVLPEELLDDIRSRLPLREIFQTSLVCKRWAQVCKSSHFCDQVCSKLALKIPNVNSKSLAKVIEYCKYHGEADRLSGDKAEDEIKTWDQDFVKVDRATLFDLILVAHHLNIKSLAVLTCQSAADMIKGKSTEEMRQILNIKNDFTPEEEEEVRREYRWA